MYLQCADMNNYNNLMLSYPSLRSQAYLGCGGQGQGNIPMQLIPTNGLLNGARYQGGDNFMNRAYFLQQPSQQPVFYVPFPQRQVLQIIPTAPLPPTSVLLPKRKLINTQKLENLQPQNNTIDDSCNGRLINPRNVHYIASSQNVDKEESRHNNSLIPHINEKNLENDKKNEISAKDPTMDRMTVVWSWNLKVELEKIAHLVKYNNYHYIGMDTEFPGFIYGESNLGRGFEPGRSYKTFKANVDSMNVIQLGITLFDENGNLSSGNHTWQFNFNFDVNSDRHSLHSIRFLGSNGINLDLHKKWGINWQEFSLLFISSGLVRTKHVKFITFHGIYDVGYLMKLIIGQDLPETERGFFEQLQIYFPYVYDLRHLVLNVLRDFDGGLQKLVDILNIKRLGRKHNGGSDAFVTGLCFFVIKRLLAESGKTISNFHLNGKLWGFSTCYSDIKNDPKYYDPLVAKEVKEVAVVIEESSNYDNTPALNDKSVKGSFRNMSCPPGFHPLDCFIPSESYCDWFRDTYVWSKEVAPEDAQGPRASQSRESGSDWYRDTCPLSNVILPEDTQRTSSTSQSSEQSGSDWYGETSLWSNAILLEDTQRTSSTSPSSGKSWSESSSEDHSWCPCKSPRFNTDSEYSNDLLAEESGQTLSLSPYSRSSSRYLDFIQERNYNSRGSSVALSESETETSQEENSDLLQ